MKNVFTELRDWAKEDPKDFFLSAITLLSMFGLFYVVIWLDAIINGRV